MPSSWPLTARSGLVDTVLADAGGASAGGVLLTGPAGVGKTRVGEEVIGRLASMPTGRAVGHPATQQIPLGALAHLLPADLAHDLGAAEDDRASTFHRARASLAERAAGERLVLLVDDVDQLDDTSLAVLLPLTVDRTIFLVATLRAGRTAPSVIDTLVKDGHVRVEEVPPLDDDEIAALLNAVLEGPIDPAARQRLASRSQGNLQVLQELVRGALSEGLLVSNEGVWGLTSLPRSGSLEELVTAHLDGLDDASLATLDVLAVAGSVGLAELEEDTDRSVLESLEARDVITVTTDGQRTSVSLTHPVYGEVLRARMPVLRLRAIQRRLADQLDRRGARRREDVTRLALWRLEAGGDVDVDVLVRAGRLALVGRDAELAARFASAAADRGAVVDAAAIAVEAALLRADHDAVEASVARVQDDPRLSETDRVHLARRLSTSRFARGDLHGALDAVRDAEAQLREPAARLGVQAQRASLLASNGRPRAALDALASIDGSRPSGGTDLRLEIELASARSTACLSVGRFDEALAAARHAATLQDDLPEWLARRGMATHLINEAHALAYAGHYREARTLIEGARAPARDRGALAAQVWFDIVLGEIARDCGYAHAAIEHFEAAATLGAAAGQHAALVWAWVGVAQGRLLLGDLKGGEAALGRADAVGGSPVATSWSTAERTRAWLMAGKGDLPGAREVLTRVADAVAADGIWTFECTLRHDLVRFGDPDAAVDRLDALAELVEGPAVQAFACHARASAAMDRAAYQEALERFEAMDRVVSAAEVAVELADVLRRQGDPRGAAAMGRRTAQLVEVSGGARTPPLLRGVAVDPLTRREREVALLAASGMASKEIAERLTVSTRTVETHLDRIYRKLGVTSRDQLADALDADLDT